MLISARIARKWLEQARGSEAGRAAPGRRRTAPTRARQPPAAAVRSKQTPLTLTAPAAGPCACAEAFSRSARRTCRRTATPGSAGRARSCRSRACRTDPATAGSGSPAASGNPRHRPPSRRPAPHHRGRCRHDHAGASAHPKLAHRRCPLFSGRAGGRTQKHLHLAGVCTTAGTA
jgi:hypothetical protein